MSNYDQITDKFEAMHLKEDLIRGVFASGFNCPSAVQQRAIMPIIEGKDVIAQVQSNTGETAAFAISCLQMIDIETRQCQAIILASTRELALLTLNVMKGLSRFMEGLETCACVGGAKIQDSVAALKAGCHIVVGTPGRVQNMLQSKALKTDNLKLIVLDDADELFSLGYNDQIHGILQLLPQPTQVVLSSATMPQDVLDITTKFMRDPVSILVKEPTLEGMKQFYVSLPAHKEILHHSYRS
ncbi:hypothetical protein ABW20_dc0102392 [Dactylellina cionopaga]|nr:hypothetical protein ABW20_dc0102392 [Dactylellina cionopaga]